MAKWVGTIEEKHINGREQFRGTDGHVYDVRSAIGRVQQIDVGKRVYVAGGVVQVESSGQRDDRLRAEEAAAEAEPVPQTLEAFIAEHGITATLTAIPGRPGREATAQGDEEAEWERTAHHYAAVLATSDGRKMETEYSTGSGWTEDPTAKDILGSLLSECTASDQAATFEEWADEFGYNTDSRRVERMYRACKAETAKVLAWLGHTRYRQLTSEVDPD